MHVFDSRNAERSDSEADMKRFIAWFRAQSLNLDLFAVASSKPSISFLQSTATGIAAAKTLERAVSFSLEKRPSMQPRTVSAEA